MSESRWLPPVTFSVECECIGSSEKNQQGYCRRCRFEILLSQCRQAIIDACASEERTVQSVTIDVERWLEPGLSEGLPAGTYIVKTTVRIDPDRHPSSDMVVTDADGHQIALLRYVACLAA